MFKSRFAVLAGMVLMAGVARLIPHPWNVTPVAAMALFAGARFSNKGQAFLVPLCALFISDLVIGFHATMPFVYAGFALIVGIGLWIRNKQGVTPVAGAVLTGAVMFFVITNFGHWMISPMYPKSLQGLFACYTAALPFFRNTLLGDAFYATLLFGSFALAEKRFPVLRQPTLTIPA